MQAWHSQRSNRICDISIQKRMKSVFCFSSVGFLVLRYWFFLTAAAKTACLSSPSIFWSSCSAASRLALPSS